MAKQGAKSRATTITRETKETKVSVSLCLDGSGEFDIETGSQMFDHMLSHIAQHGLFDIKIQSAGWDQHHVVEDVAIALSQALNKVLGNKKGIVRMGHAFVPMDEALAMIAIDISGRGYAVLDTPFKRKKIGDMESDLVRHFLGTFAIEGKINLHAGVSVKGNDHHKAEALFKALGRALDSATQIDSRISGKVPSTKGVIER